MNFQKTADKTLIIITLITLFSIFFSIFLPALLSESFLLDYRFKHFFNGSDFSFYYNNALNHFWNFETLENLREHQINSGMPELFFDYKSTPFPVTDELFLPFTALPFFNAYYLYLIIAVSFFVAMVAAYFKKDYMQMLFYLSFVFVSYPFIASLEKGQASLLLPPMLILFFLLLENKRYFFSLVVLAIVTHLKIFPLFIFFGFLVYLISIKKYKEILFGIVMAIVWVALNIDSYIKFLEYVFYANDEWSKQGGIINHSIFSFSYFVKSGLGIDLEFVLKTISWVGFFYIIWLIWKKKEISKNAWIFLFSFSSIVPGSSFFYNLVIFFPLILLLKKEDFLYTLLIGIILAYPLHLGLKGVLPDVLLGLVSIKFIPLFLLMAVSFFKEYKDYKKGILCQKEN